MRKRPKVEGFIIEKEYRVDQYITGGAFGALFAGTNIKTKQMVAIKLESKDAEAPQLPLEFRFYSLLGKHKGIPEVYYFGPCSLYHAIVMEMLGPSLENMHQFCGKKLSADTTARIAKQILSIIEFIHNKHIIFRDTKPENFLLGRKGTQKQNVVHIIDFGLAKEYINRNTGKHIPYRTGKSLIGTPRYMSTWCHLGLEQSRRDDMESIGFLLIYFIKGSLPWMGLKTKPNQRYIQIGKVKRETPIDKLCSGIPEPFELYMKNVKQLNFYSKPDYKQLSDYFESLIDNNGKYDWEDNTIDSHNGSQISTQTVRQTTVS